MKPLVFLALTLTYHNGPCRDAPDVDPLGFLGEASAGLPPLAVGQLRRCRITGSSLFDLEAQPVA